MRYNIYYQGEFLGNVWANTREEAFRLARKKFSQVGIYVTTSCEGQ